MIRADADGYAAGMPPSSPDLPRFPLTGGPSPLAPLARLSAALGGRAERLDQARGPSAAGVRWQQAAQPRVPRRRGAGRRRRHARHVRPALVEPLPADGGGRRRAGLDVHLVLSGPPVDPPGPNERLDELLGATVHVSRDRPTGPSAKRSSIRSSPRSATPAAAVRDRRRRHRAGRCRRPVLAGARARSARPRARADRARRDRPADGDRWDAGRAPCRVAARRVGGHVSSAIAWPRRGRAPSADRRPCSTGSRLSPGSRSTRPRSSSTTRSSAPAMAGRRPRPTRRAACSPGPRGSSSTRSTPRRLWPASSAGPRRALRRPAVVFWHAGGLPGLFEPLDDGPPRG